MKISFLPHKKRDEKYNAFLLNLNTLGSVERFEGTSKVKVEGVTTLDACEMSWTWLKIAWNIKMMSEKFAGCCFFRMVYRLKIFQRRFVEWELNLFFIEIHCLVVPPRFDIFWTSKHTPCLLNISNTLDEVWTMKIQFKKVSSLKKLHQHGIHDRLDVCKQQIAYKKTISCRFHVSLSPPTTTSLANFSHCNLKFIKANLVDFSLIFSWVCRFFFCSYLSRNPHSVSFRWKNG